MDELAAPSSSDTCVRYAAPPVPMRIPSGRAECSLHDADNTSHRHVLLGYIILNHFPTYIQTVQPSAYNECYVDCNLYGGGGGELCFVHPPLCVVIILYQRHLRLPCFAAMFSN